MSIEDQTQHIRVSTTPEFLRISEKVWVNPMSVSMIRQSDGGDSVYVYTEDGSVAILPGEQAGQVAGRIMRMSEWEPK